MKTIRITEHGLVDAAERDIDVLTKEELLALGYEEVADTMRKNYPADAPYGREVAVVIFDKVPEMPDLYAANNKFLTLFYYERSWDVADFLRHVTKAVFEYRVDMKELGFQVAGEAEEGEAE